MADYNNVKINGNAYQKQKLKETFGAVKQYCDQGSINEIKNTVFEFDKNLPEDVNALQIKKGGKNHIILPENFTEKPLKRQGKTLCHGLSHVAWANNHPYALPVGSKEDEFQAIINGDSFEKTYSKARDEYYSPVTKREIKNLLKYNPSYRCLPEKDPASEYDYQIAMRKYNACENINTIKDFILGFFKPKKSK